MEFLLAEGLLQAWQKFTSPFVHPKDTVGQGLAMLIHRDKCLALVRDAQGPYLPAIHLINCLAYCLDC